MAAKTTLDDVLGRYGALPQPAQAKAQSIALAATAHMQWVPNPGAQTDAYLSEADILFYGGAAGGGKSDLILGVALNTACKARIFRKHFKDIDGTGGLASRLAAIRGKWDGYNRASHVCRLGKEREIEFGAFTNEQEAEAYQGRPADFYGVDEITQYPEKLIRFLLTWNRSTTPGQRVRAIFTGNPPVTAEGRWVIKFFAPWLDPQYPNPAKPGELRWVTTIDGEDVWVDGPEEIEVDGEMVKPRSRTYIPAALEDNPDLAETDYGAQLAGLPEPYRSAFKNGDFGAAMDDDDWQVIPSEWVIKAQHRYTLRMADPAFKLGRMTSMGVDVAQGGKDNTVLAPLYSVTFGELVRAKGVDTKNGAEASAFIIRHVRDGAVINIDCGGGWGNAAFEILDSNDMHVQACIGAGGSRQRDRSKKFSFKNKRAEWWWLFREALDPENGDDVALPPDGQLFADLTAVRRLKSEDSTVIQIESKDDLRKRILRSPDDGDAVVMAWANVDPDLRRERKSRERRRNPHSRRSGQVQAGYASAKDRYRR